MALSLFIAAAALDPAVTLTLMDGKQVELAPWAGSAERFVGPDMAEAIEVLKDLCAEMDRRYSVLLADGLRKIEREGEFGLHVVAIDELAFYMRSGTKDERNQLSETLRDLISRGRAAGMVVIAATQKPSNDIVPTFVRDLFSFRMALRCTTPEASDTILGQGWAKEGYSASTLDPTNRGVGYLLAEGAVPVKIRTHCLDDEAIASLAERAKVTAGPAVNVERRLASSPRRGQPGRAAAPTRSGCGVSACNGTTGELVDGHDPRRRARTAGRPSAHRAPASTRPTPGSWWLPASGAARAWSPDVVEHPQLFVTLTAPSFGPVHRSRRPQRAPGRPCRPRRSGGSCPHGSSLVVP